MKVSFLARERDLSFRSVHDHDHDHDHDRDHGTVKHGTEQKNSRSRAKNETFTVFDLIIIKI